jgi:hypothetical protein
MLLIKKKSLPFLSIIMGIIVDVLDHVIIKKNSVFFLSSNQYKWFFWILDHTRWPKLKKILRF